jgi:tetratricopeptide (TPR) repeat protein
MTHRKYLLYLLSTAVLSIAAFSATALASPELERARDRQDRAALDQIIAKLQSQVKSSGSPANYYQLALAYSYASETAMEQRDKKKAEQYAESGIDEAQKAVDGGQNNAEYHRILGQLCGQVIPANPLLGGLKYGQCAKEEVNKAIQLDSKSALAYISRGVGNYYLPAQFGGGIDLAIKDFDKAIALNSKLSDAYLWKGIALRKANKNGEARAALEKAVQLNPESVWAKGQLEKTPAH